MTAPLDGKILHALQLSPRVWFRRIGDVLGVPEHTVARRYRAMRRDGAIRVIGMVNPQVYGECQWVVRLRARPDTLPNVAEALTQRPEVTHVNVLSGSTELVCIVRAPLAEDSDGILHRLPRTSAVLSMTVDLVLHVFGDSSGAVWTGYGHTLTAAQTAALVDVRPERSGGVVPPGSEDLPLLEALSQDGRIAHAQLAELTGWSPARVKRRIAAMESAGTLTYDVDVLTERLGFGVHALIWMAVTPLDLTGVAEQLLAHAEIASVIAVSGPHNLLAVVIARDVDHLHRYITDQLGKVRHVQGYDVAVRTQRLKQAGSLISHGRLLSMRPARR
ncbi:Lrp/AsnC family transcriptional regulator [Mycolicibacterium rhodesiae]|uniref:AsnC family transcriptional regulator n=1 Tax=Mycolicibacterium rhodesiae TaxID=36814 RepID=A0A1X0J2R9_MYCRH|nr:Lrp/AsnC family transcriptional regulator [Mycolicibacterium rhodesiae]MCV7348024.1 Lrp/AsnC family transcriptional regulator [Mycolicibacterium rhodesiae]ORB56126.1 AsnC family transcriptional regulator [Mycolicibacterium rhodesiae]